MGYINSCILGQKIFLRVGSFSEGKPMEVKWKGKIKTLHVSMDGTKTGGCRSLKHKVGILGLLQE